MCLYIHLQLGYNNNSNISSCRFHFPLLLQIEFLHASSNICVFSSPGCMSFSSPCPLYNYRKLTVPAVSLSRLSLSLSVRLPIYPTVHIPL